jgi:hypothetical protein
LDLELQLEGDFVIQFELAMDAQIYFRTEDINAKRKVYEGS